MKIKKIKSSKIKYFIALHIELLLFSLGGICSKMAGKYDFLSFWFIFFYGLVILNLGVYAIVWQQIIKHLPLNTAYSNKAITIVWGILWGVIFFQEKITWNMILGAVIVIIGVILVVKADE
jgi:drug/metabolite transporter (DMT)-like permease